MALADHEILAASGMASPQDTMGIVSDTDKRDVSEILDLLVVKETPFLNTISWGPESGATKIEWISENLGPGYVVVASTMASAGTTVDFTTLDGMTTLEATKQILTGTLAYYHNSTDLLHTLAIFTVVTSADCEIEILVTSGTATSSIEAGTKMYILGDIMNEGSLPRDPRPRNRAVRNNVFSILREDVAITGSMMNTDMHAINREDLHQLAMRMTAMQKQRETMALYSDKLVRSSTEAALMHGVFGFLASMSGDHIDITTRTLTESAFNTVVSSIWEHGGRNLTFYGNIAQTAKFTQWDKNRIRTTINEGRGGGYIREFLTESGLVVKIIPLPFSPKNLAFVLDPTLIKLRAKKNRKALLEKLGKQGDSENWQLLSEFTMEMKGYDLGKHGMFTNLS